MQDAGQRLRREAFRLDGKLKRSGSDGAEGELPIVASQRLLL